MAQCATLSALGTDGPIAVRQIAASELIAHGYLDAARPLCDTAIALTGQLPDSVRSKDRRLASLFAQCGRWAEARPIYERELSKDPANVQLIVQVGVANGFLGNRRMAETMMRRIPMVTDTSAEARNRKRQVLRHRARIAAAMGDKEQAIGFLREAVDLGTVPVFDFHRDRALEALRGYAPYEQLFKPRE
jgi:tetratricopeptide (TPR) repeat protein